MVLYLILSHHNPTQVMRLARRIVTSDPQALVLIHHDARAPALAPSDDSRICIMQERVGVRWGDFSIVAALLHCLRWIADIPFDWMVLLSGQDYPSAPLAGLSAALDASDVNGFIGYSPFQLQRFAEDNTTRYLFTYQRLPDELLPVAKRAWRFNKMQPWLRVVGTRAGCFVGVRSSAPFNRRFSGYRCSFWWTLSKPCVDYVRTFVKEHPQVVRAFKRKLIPDEAFISSVLINANCFTFASHDQRFLVWPHDESASPMVLKSHDYDAIVNSGMPFARKFDITVDADILERLDAYVEGVNPTFVSPAATAHHRINAR
jgi:hypothetical protein